MPSRLLAGIGQRAAARVWMAWLMPSRPCPSAMLDVTVWSAADGHVGAHLHQPKVMTGSLSSP